MTLAELKALAGAEPPPGLAPALRALWWTARGDWDQAHGIVMNEDDAETAWVHALLHRIEGDPGNAAYWYRQAGRPVATGSLDAEWEEIAAALLAVTPSAMPPRTRRGHSR